MIKFLNLKVAAAVFALLLAGCDGWKHHLSSDGASLASKFDPSERTLKIEGNDKPLVLFFYTSGCGACKAQVPVLNELQASGDALIIGILGDGKGLEADAAVAREKGIKFPSVSGASSVKYFETIVGGIFGTPTSVIYDKNGKAVKKLIGLYPKSAFETQLKLMN